LKSFNSSVALLLVLAFVGLYIYFVEYKSYKEKKRKNTFFINDVDELSVIDPIAKKGFELLNKNGTWYVNGKPSADNKEINTIVYTLKGKPEKVVSDPAKDTEVREYGLDNPIMIINVKNYANKVNETLYVGTKAPVGFGRYILIKSRNTIVISSEIYDSFNKEVK